MKLTSAQKKFFWDNGFLAVENVVDATLVKAMVKRIEQLCTAWDSEEAKRVGMQQEAEIAGALAKLAPGVCVPLRPL